MAATNLLIILLMQSSTLKIKFACSDLLYSTYLGGEESLPGIPLAISLLLQLS